MEFITKSLKITELISDYLKIFEFISKCIKITESLFKKCKNCSLHPVLMLFSGCFSNRPLIGTPVILGENLLKSFLTVHKFQKCVSDCFLYDYSLRLMGRMRRNSSRPSRTTTSPTPRRSPRRPSLYAKG